jgi:hypothetical protein
MRILPPIEEEIRRTVRDARAKDPLISVSGLKGVLESHFHRGFSHQYVSKIADKVMREALVQLDRTKIQQRMNFTRENYRMMRERLLKIVYWQAPEPADDSDHAKLEAHKVRPPYDEDVIEAAKTLVMMDLALLRAEIETGMYRDEQEAAATLRYAPMPPDRRQVVIGALIAWGMLPKEQVEAIVPALPLANGATTTTTSVA